MTTLAMSDQRYTRELGDGLVLRWSNAADTERIATLYNTVFRRKADEPNIRVAGWTRELMSGTHPLITANDFAVVEDTRSGTIAASTCLMRATWDYAGIALPVGRPEIVATLAEYRNRGLVRAIFELIHARSDGRGDMAQGITGIPYYYRQFGYEYAIDLGGWKNVPFAAIPKLKENERELYSLRASTLEDLPFVMELYEQERKRAGVSAQISADYWRYTITEQAVKQPDSGEGWRTYLIVDAEGRPIGYVLPRRLRWGASLGLAGLWIEQGRSWVAVLPSVLRGLHTIAAETNTWNEGEPAADEIMLHFGRAHPAYDVLGPYMAAKHEQPYAWYVRVPDLPGFIRHIAPVLEQRLANSAVASHNGELRLNFYRGGLKLVFDAGRITAVEPWRVGHHYEPGPHAGFPPLAFLHVLFGHHTVEELHTVLPDVWAGDEGRPLLAALFPKQSQWVMPLD